MCLCVACGLTMDDSTSNYHKPDEKPPGGTRFLLITCLAPFKDGTVVFISRWYPSPVIGLRSNVKTIFKKQIRMAVSPFRTRMELYIETTNEENK